MRMRAQDGAGKVYDEFWASHLSKPLDKLKVSQQYQAILTLRIIRQILVCHPFKPLSIGLILTNSSLTRVQQAKEIKTIGSLFCCSSCRLLFSKAIGLSSCSYFPPVVKVHNSNSKYKYWYLLIGQSFKYQYICLANQYVPVTSILVVYNIMSLSLLCFHLLSVYLTLVGGLTLVTYQQHGIPCFNQTRNP